MKKNWLALILAGAMACSMTACGGSSGTPATAGGGDTASKGESAAAADQGDQAAGEGIEKPSSPLRYSLGTSSSGGNFYLVGGGIATILNNSLPDYFVITSEETGGSTANLGTIKEADLEAVMASEPDVIFIGGRLASAYDALSEIAPVVYLATDPETGLVPLGDMCVSLERAAAQAEEFGHSVERELSYLTVHSVLHLLGYDHLDEGPMKARMRAREEAILEGLGITRETEQEAQP